jgi:glycosyl hydrolase family 44
LTALIAIAVAAAGGMSAAPPPVSLPIVEGGRIAPGWTDLGWAAHTFQPGQVKLDLSDMGGWILSHEEIKPGGAGGLFLRLRLPADAPVEVSLDSHAHSTFPRLALAAARRVRLQGDVADFWIAIDALDPSGAPFDRVVLRATKQQSNLSVDVLLVGLTPQGPPRAQKDDARPARAATVTLDCAKTQPISSGIYGVSFGDEATFAELGASARRWGGNPTSRYNWRLGNAWNTGSDHYFRNVDISSTNGSWQSFLEAGNSRGAATAFTVPMIGWVAKDTASCSFPVGTFGGQARLDPDNRQCGNGISVDGAPLPTPPQSGTSVPAPPEFVADWVRAIRAKEPKAQRLYYLDNEPTLWHATHRDVHPERVSYDELLERTLSYGRAIRAADAEARIAGFTGWGWTSLFFSGADKAEGKDFVPLDRMRHGGKQLLPWWLAQVRREEKRTGERILDVVDVHFYPQADGMGLYADGWTDLESCARRIRSVRALWDPTYKDESWIGEPVRLIPRLRDWIHEESPGLGISIGEYNFGAEGHISGGLAVAEALGRFGVERVDYAFYWPMPPKGSAAYWGFRAFRNYDGNGGRVGEVSVAASSSDKGLSSVFATRKRDGSLVVVALNHEPDKPLDLSIDGGSCGPMRFGRRFSYGGEGGLAPMSDKPGGPARERLLPWSINVLELTPRK